MSEDTVRIEWTPQEVFLRVMRLYLLQGIIRGSVYGASFGTILGLYFGPLGLLYGIPLGLGIGLLSGTAMGLIGGCILGAFSVSWGRRQGGVMSEQHTVNRDGYRRGVIAISVGITLLVFLLLAVVLEWRNWFSGDYYPVAVAAVPVLLAGFASFQAAKKIIDWYETQVGLPRTVMVWNETAQEGVWPPPPQRPEA